MLPLTVANQLRRSISRGVYEPGQRLNEVALAAELEISRNTLREALASLINDGLCERIPHRGVVLATPSPQALDDVYRARATIEPGALMFGGISPEDLSPIVDKARAARVAADWDEVGMCNQLFHLQIVRSAGSDKLEAAMTQLAAYMRLAFLTVTLHVPDFHAPYVDDNLAVIEALRDRGRPDAAHLLREQLLRTFTQVDELLRTHDPNYAD